MPHFIDDLSFEHENNIVKLSTVNGMRITNENENGTSDEYGVVECEKET